MLATLRIQCAGLLNSPSAVHVGSGFSFGFASTPNGLLAFFNLAGYIENRLDGSRMPYTGTSSATFNGIAETAELTASLPVQTPYSATFPLLPFRSRDQSY
jgi:hypothetical protein